MALGIMEVEMSHVKEAVLDLTKTTKTLVEQVRESTALTVSFQDTAERLGSKIDDNQLELKEVRKEVTNLKIAKAAVDAKAEVQNGLTKAIGKVLLTAVIGGLGTLAYYIITLPTPT